MLTRLRQLMDFELTVADLIGIGLLLGAPYLIVGLVWSSTHSGALRGLGGVDLLVSLLGSIVLWPAMLLANVCAG
jgi:hypothetical protein